MTSQEHQMTLHDTTVHIHPANRLIISDRLVLQSRLFKLVT